MSSPNPVVPLSKLNSGYFDQDILVKVDRIITKDVVCFPLGPDRPMREQKAIHVVVFDASNTRMLLVLDEPAIMRDFAHMFAEERIFRITNFYVCVDRDTGGKKLYVHFRLSTRVSHVMHSSRILADPLPTHCFDLLTVSQVNTGGASNMGLVDVCGFLVAIYENGMEDVDGMLCREVIMVLEDNGVIAPWEPNMVTCVLHGSCADDAFRAYNRAPKNGRVFVVVQFALATIEEDPKVVSYHDATRAFFNPSFPELVAARLSLIDRLGAKDHASSLPLLDGNVSFHSEAEGEGNKD